MSLQYVIDAYNVIKSPDFPRSKIKTGSSVSWSLNLLEIKKLCGSRRNTAFLVFDGYPDKYGRYDSDDGQFKLIFSRQESADERIKRIIEAGTDKKNLIVVSNDKEIISFARFFKVKSITTGEFLKIEAQGRHLEKLKTIAEETKNISYSQMHEINEELKNIWLKR